MRRDVDVCEAAVLQTRGGVHNLSIRVADSFFRRFRGLMLTTSLADDQGLLITHCNAVHTALMRYAIDLVYLDKMGKIVKCVAGIKPWRCSLGYSWNFGNGGFRATHVLELQAGSIEQLRISPGDQLESSSLRAGADGCQTRISPGREQGSAMIEFALVGPIITLLGMAIMQYSLLFFAKNQVNYATFMAARAGSMGNARINNMKLAYIRALIPLYGGGESSDELKRAFDRASEDVSTSARLELLNPTRESFDDWQDQTLKETVGNGRRVIPNDGLAFKNPNVIGPNSGQSIQDANLIRIRITHGYEMKVPLINSVIQYMLRWGDDGSNPFITELYKNHRIPVVSYVTLQMQSDAIEPDDTDPSLETNVGSLPQKPEETTTDTQFPPSCLTIGCTVIFDPDTQENIDPVSGPSSPPLGCPPGDPDCAQMCKVAAGGP